MPVVVVVPWRPGCPDRHRAWEWVRAQYARHHPDWTIVEARAPEGVWVKAAAVNPAVEDSPPGYIVVVADADVWCPGVAAAVTAVKGGEPWAMPHRAVRRLTRDATTALIGGHDDIFTLDLDECPYVGVWGGGIVAATRETLLDAPLDPRFRGWGSEDVSWALALTTIAGHPWRGKAQLVHLWHPPQQRMSRRYGSPESVELSRRYHHAASSPQAMRELLREVKSCPSPAS